MLAARPLHWNFFYETGGRTLTNLYRRLGRLRHRYQCLRSRQSWYYHARSDLGRGLIAWLDYLHGASEQDAWSLDLAAYATDVTVTIPSNYGRILIGERG